MRNLQQQRGITFWGLSFVLGILAIFLFIGFKLFPPYMESFKVKGALDGLARQPDAGSMTKADVTASLSKRFDVDNISGVNLSKDVTVETRGRTKIIRIRYENVIPVIGNLSILLEFDHAKEVKSSGAE